MRNKVSLISLCLLVMQAIFTMAISAEARESVDDKWPDGDERSISESPVQLYLDGSTLYIERVTFLSDINICIGTGAAILYEGVLPVDTPMLEVELGNATSEVMWIIVKDGVGSYSMEFTIPNN